jgi:hypothetical protein
MVEFITNESLQYALSFGYDEKYKEGSVNTKLPDLQSDNRLNWKHPTEQKSPAL